MLGTSCHTKSYLLGEEIGVDETIRILVDEFETPEIQKLYKNYAISEVFDSDREEALNEEVSNVILRLENAREEIPIEANKDWREAVIIAYRRYKAKKIIESIPLAYEDYLMRLESGIGFTIPENAELPEYMVNIKQHILEGRRLAGE